MIEKIIRESVDYDPETGAFKWKEERPAEHFTSTRAYLNWKSRFAGKEISGVCKYERRFYRHIRVNRTKHKAHRVAWLLYYGNWPKGDIDHIDGDGLNNRISNLRDVPRQINSRNCMLSKNNSSGANGIHFRKDTGKWVARGSLVIDGEFVREYLGQFDSLEDAKIARKAWETSQGNFTERHGKAVANAPEAV